MCTVAGHLREKRGYYHMVFNYTDENGKRHEPSKSTGLKVKGNKRKAEAMLREEIINLEQQLEEEQLRATAVTGSTGNIDSNILFTVYLQSWLDMVRGNIEVSTYGGYSANINNHIIPYFEKVYPNLLLKDVQPFHIQNYYTYEKQTRNISNNTLLRRHANIRKALQYAMKTGMIPINPADRIDRPKSSGYKANFYTEDELNHLLQIVKGDPLEFGVMTAAFYGLRRSEIVGLKWNAINFTDKTITIQHTVTEANIDGKHILVQKDRTKTQSSYRTLPLVPAYERVLLEMQERQVRNRELCGSCYNKEFLEYIYVDDLGNLIRPDYMTLHFKLLLKNNNLRSIRFHDLRHSCASLLLAHGVNLKQIQEWLGHSTISTTGNIYAHLDVDAKRNSANAIVGLLENR